jgi:hypothetical protein
MRFSDCFGITGSAEDDWFDPILSVDTELFIDPFLLYAGEEGQFIGSHDEVISFFNACFRLIAQSAGKKSSVYYEKAVNLLVFPEVQELCLGYTSQGTSGSGSGVELARLTAAGMWKAIETGLKEITHFEEVALLQKGIGADRISDITAGILVKRIAEYTAFVCEDYGIPVQETRFRNGSFDTRNQWWVPVTKALPGNPYNDKPVLLVPRRYLRSLPSINGDDFWSYCWNNENETLRREFNYDISRRVPKTKIIGLARKRPDLRAAYLAYRERHPTDAYDFYADRRGIIKWYEASRDYRTQNPLHLSVASRDEFFRAVDQLVNDFRHFVEENAGWRLLWNDNYTSRGEKAAQLLFLGTISHGCRANDIDISKEADIGRGPVDFKVSRGYALRVLLEVKLARNTRFWNGLEKQLPTYQKAEQVDCAYFVVIAFSDKDLKRVNKIHSIVHALNSRSRAKIKAVVVDASPDKPSASRL